jgi:hypothetical protein
MHLSQDRVVDLYKHSAWLPVVLAVDMPIDPLPVPKLAGRIQNMKAGDVLRVKLIGIFDDTSLSSQPDDTGRFSFAGMPPGRYLLLVYSGEVLVRQADAKVNYFETTVLNLTL